MASEYYEPKGQVNKMFHDLREGLKKGLYRTIECKGCRRPIGVINKAFYGISVYCNDCVEAQRARIRRG